jgi:hypothetical protein
MRVLLAALVGAIIVFIVSALLHMFTPLGTAGLKVLRSEGPVVDALRDNIQTSGVYMFPGMDPRTKPTVEQQKAWEERLAAGPYGLIIYTAEGVQAMTPRQLGTEFVANLIAALIGGWILTMCGGTYLQRAIVIAMLAAFAWFSLSASHVIWYRFPLEWVAAEGVMEVVAWLLAGLAMAKIVRPRIFAIVA